MYSYNEVKDFVKEEDVKFIRLAFCDIYGKQKNISILPDELSRAFTDGISFDASAIQGFGEETKSDLLLFPDPSTLAILPWRTQSGRVVRMFCDIVRPDGQPFEIDGRYILKQAIKAAKEKGISCNFGSEFEFYLFKTDAEGNPTKIPFDNATYMDIAPEDKGENIRREICLTLCDMGIRPESSHHEEGPGQHEIDFRYDTALKSADNATAFKSVVKTIAMRNGLFADMSAKPLADKSGNGMHINISVKSDDNQDYTMNVMAGIMERVQEITAFLNASEASYVRLGSMKAPKYVSWSYENRSQLIRIPAAKGEYKRIELRSPDPSANPYIAFAMLIYAALDGIERNLMPGVPCDYNLYKAPQEVTSKLKKLPASYEEAKKLARESEFVRKILPEVYLK